MTPPETAWLAFVSSALGVYASWDPTGLVLAALGAMAAVLTHVRVEVARTRNYESDGDESRGP